MVAVAIGGSAIIGAGTSMISGKKAAKAQSAAADQAAANERYFYDTAREDMSPYRQIGYGALNKLAAMYGVAPVDAGGRTPLSDRDYAAYVDSNPDLQQEFGRVSGQFGGSKSDYGRFHYDKYGGGEGRNIGAPTRQEPTAGTGQMGYSGDGAFTASPGYQFRLAEGIKAAERSAAARGSLASGGTLKAIQRYGEGLASDEYNNYANRLAALAGVGQTATSATQQAGAQASGNISNALMASGNAKASSYANTGSAINQGVNNLASLYLYQQGGGFGGGKTPPTYGGTPPIYGGNLGGVY